MQFPFRLTDTKGVVPDSVPIGETGEGREDLPRASLLAKCVVKDQGQVY